MATGMAQWGNDLYSGRRSYDIVGGRRRWFGISIAFVVASILILVFKGLTPSIEFEGGTEFVIANPSELTQQIAIDTVAELYPGEAVRVSTVGENSMRVQMSALEGPPQVEEVRQALASAYDVPASNVSTSLVGPTWGQDVSTMALIGVVVFLALVMLAMTFYFRTWRMAVAAIISLLQDVVITVGIYAAVGFEVSPATVIGLMTILAYSIYDIVVVFDKVRENTTGVFEQTRSTYAEKANLAVNQTLVRSINTSVVALLPVAAILFVGAFLLGAGTLRDISLALFVGITVGAFSSIFVATPIEVSLQEAGEKVREHTARVLAMRAEAAEATGTEQDAALIAAAGAGEGGYQLVPGSHQGNRAQPRKHKKR